MFGPELPVHLGVGVHNLPGVRGIEKIEDQAKGLKRFHADATLSGPALWGQLCGGDSLLADGGQPHTGRGAASSAGQDRARPHPMAVLTSFLERQTEQIAKSNALIEGVGRMLAELQTAPIAPTSAAAVVHVSQFSDAVAKANGEMELDVDGLLANVITALGKSGSKKVTAEQNAAITAAGAVFRRRLRLLQNYSARALKLKSIRDELSEGKTGPAGFQTARVAVEGS